MAQTTEVPSASGKGAWGFEHEHIHVILITNANEMHYFSVLFGTELYMFRTDLLSIIRSLNTVFTATGICHTGYVAVY